MPRYLVAISPDVTTKSSWTRRRFQRRLIANIEAALAAGGLDGRVDDRWGRLLVEASDDAARDTVAAVFGVHAVFEVEAQVPVDLDEIVRVGEARFADRVRGKAFAVRARRAGRQAIRSRDVEVALGAALDKYGHVDLTHPDVTVHVETRDGASFLYAHRVAGVGGLPLGVEGRAVALLSGGFDSPVASWMMLRRGIALHYVFCNLAGDAYERSVVAVAKVLTDMWSFGESPLLHVVDFTEPVAELKRAVDEQYWQVVLKRLMYRTAAAVAQKTEAHAIVTGESVGQVSSQTLPNLRAIEATSPFPVFRPLLGLDKLEIMERAGRVGTAVVSAQVKEYCALGKGRPITNASASGVSGQEGRMDSAVLERAIAATRVVDLRVLDETDLVGSYLFAADIQPDACVVDCRTLDQFAQWHYPGAERWDPTELAARFRSLDKDRSYLLYCGVGVQSAHVAELMQQSGYDAYSFKGGVPALRRWVQARGSGHRGEVHVDT